MAITYEKMKTYTVPDGNDKVQYEIVDDAGRKMIAPDWDVSYDEAFAVGDYVANDGKLYRFTSPHNAGDSWDDEEVTEITVTDEIQTVKAGKADKVSVATNGNLAGVNGDGNPTDSGYAVDDTASDSTKLWTAEKVKGVTDSKAPVITDTVSNVAIASIPDVASNLPLTALRFAVEPIQAGNGDPYPAGGGKNKLKPITADSGEISGVAYTVYDDGTIKINGTATGAHFNLYFCGSNSTYADLGIPSGEYKLNGIPSGSACTITLIDSDGNSQQTGAGNDKTITVDDTKTYRLYLRLPLGNTATNEIIKAMIRPSSVADSTFAPYENICPITGRTGAVVAVTGNNLMTGIISGKAPGSTGTINTSTGYQSNIAPIKKGVTYTFMTSGSNVYAFYTEEPDVGSVAYDNTRHTDSNTFTAPIDGWVVFRSPDDYATPMIVVGTTLGDYVAPITGTTATVQFGSTVYGATIDWVNGVLVVGYALDTMTGNNVVSVGTASSGINYARMSELSSRGVTTTAENKDQLKSNLYVASKDATMNNSIRINANTTPYAYNNDLDTLEKAQAFYNANPLQIWYPLYTPIEIPLSDLDEIRTVLGGGTMNLWSDSGDIVLLEYPVDTKTFVQEEAADKADKVPTATENNFAAFDSNGNLKDSGKKASDFLTSHQDISGKADKVSSPTAGNFAALDSNGNLTDSGHKHSDYAPNAFVLANDFDASENSKVNLIATPYSMNQFLQGKLIYGDGTINDSSNSCTSPLIPVSAGTYGLKTAHNSIGLGQIKSGNSYKNGYGFFAADGTTVVARPTTLLHNISGDIFVFDVPSDAKYVRFSFGANSQPYYETACGFFNSWILLPNANDQITDTFFDLGIKKGNGTTDKIKRTDGSYLELRDNRFGIRTRMQYGAHNGAEYYAPECTVPAYRIAGQQRWEYAWMSSIHFSSEGSMYVIHDDTVDRTTDGTGYINQMTDAQIDALHIDQTGEGYDLSDFDASELKIPTFEQAIQQCVRYGMKMVIGLHMFPTEYTSADAIAKWDVFVNLLKAYNVPTGDISCYVGTAATAAICRNLLGNDAEIAVFLGQNYTAQDYVDWFTTNSITGNRAAIINVSQLDLTAVKLLHSNGIRVYACGSHAETDAINCASWGVDVFQNSKLHMLT